MKYFQIIVIAIFALFAVVGVIFFAGFKPGGSTEGAINNVEIWGTVDRVAVTNLLGKVRSNRVDFKNVTYIEKDPRTFDSVFIEALASDKGPDLFLLEQDSIVRHSDKIIPIPYENFSERTFKDVFIEEGELYLTPEGVLGVPFMIDPMVLYWNRDMFSSSGISKPPQYWDEFFTLSPKITQRDQASNIVKSFTALGEYRNVVHAKEILSALIMQAGNKIIERGANGTLNVVLENKNDFSIAPAEAALLFYTEFSNPVQSVYSWNRALPDSRKSFISGDLALYIGFSSELLGIRQANPNLNFDVTHLPQSRDSDTKTTFGSMFAFAVPKSSSDVSGSFSAALALVDPLVLASFSEETGLPPVRRDLLASSPTDAFRSVFYDSALMSRAWLDPKSSESSDIFKRMIENVTSGRLHINESVKNASDELENLLP